jgi:hypothetical protein
MLPVMERSWGRLPRVRATALARTLLLCLLGLALRPALAGEGVDSSADSGSKKTAVDFRYPKRDYIRATGPWRIYVEQSLVDRKPEFAKRVQAKLEDTLSYVFGKLPEGSKRVMTDVDVYLLWGTESPHGGRASGMSYIRRGEPRNYPRLDPRWEHAVVIYSADNFMYLDKLWASKALMHELAHCWHIGHWPEKHPAIYEPWLRARDKNLYRDVKDYKGKTLAKAYASKNQLEYFAELSAIYFVGGNYQPFDRPGLKAYDPIGYAMVESLWGVDGAGGR